MTAFSPSPSLLERLGVNPALVTRALHPESTPPASGTGTAGAQRAVYMKREGSTIPSSRPLPIHGEYIEDVLFAKSGRQHGEKSLRVQFENPGRAASNRRRLELLADPLRLARSRHPRWLGVKRDKPRKRKAEKLPVLHIDEAPLVARIAFLHDAKCLACLSLVTAPRPVPADFVSRQKLESDYIEPAQLPDLLAS